MNFLYFLPVVDTLIAGGVTFALAKYLLPRVFIQKISEKVISTDFNSYAEPLVERKIELFIEQMKNQIPLASMFISTSLIDKLKNQGKEEILKAIPDIKRHLLEKLEKKPFDFNPFILRITLLGAGLGGLLGLFNLIWFLWQ